MMQPTISIVTYGNNVGSIQSFLTEHAMTGFKLEVSDSRLSMEMYKNYYCYWLDYIVNNYYQLPDYCIFFKDTLHVQTKFGTLDTMLHALREKPWMFLDRTFWNFVTRCNENGLPHHPDLPIKQMFATIFPTKPIPAAFEFVCGGQIMLPKAQILKHSREFYNHLLTLLVENKLNEFVMERLWGYVFM